MFLHEYKSNCVWDFSIAESKKKGERMEKLINDCINLGFGMMRLPRISRNGMEVIDVERTADMVDAFLAAGGKH